MLAPEDEDGAERKEDRHSGASWGGAWHGGALALGCAELWPPGWPLVPACPVPGRHSIFQGPHKSSIPRLRPLL